MSFFSHRMHATIALCTFGIGACASSSQYKFKHTVAELEQGIAWAAENPHAFGTCYVSKGGTLTNRMDKIECSVVVLANQPLTMTVDSVEMAVVDQCIVMLVGKKRHGMTVYPVKVTVTAERGYVLHQTGHIPGSMVFTAIPDTYGRR